MYVRTFVRLIATAAPALTATAPPAMATAATDAFVVPSLVTLIVDVGSCAVPTPLMFAVPVIADTAFPPKYAIE